MISNHVFKITFNAMIYLLIHFFFAEDMEFSTVKCNSQNEILPIAPSVELPITKEPIKFSEIRSRSCNQ